MKAKQLKLIELKILQPHLSNEDIAKELCVHRHTIENWLKDDEVKQELKKRTDECWAELIYQAQLTMCELLQDPNSSVRLGAGKYILDSLGRGAEQKIDVTTKGKTLIVQKASDVNK